jgi:hypothetical protein
MRCCSAARTTKPERTSPLRPGLGPYAIHEIRASRWISEAERVNSIHPYYQGGWHACCGTW